MFTSFFTIFLYTPLYNALIFIIGHIPNGDVGVAVILLTILVRLILFPLSKGGIKTQMKMKEYEPELNAIKEKYKDNKEEQAKKTMEFYQKNGINPLSGILFLFLQIPIILVLSTVFYHGGLPSIDTALLYPFVKVPAAVSMKFLGLINVGSQNIILGALAGISQFFQIRFLVPAHKKVEGKEPNFQDDFAHSMNVNMRYVMPAFVFFIALTLSGAISIYWMTGNVAAVLQEIYFRKTIKNKPVVVK